MCKSLLHNNVRDIKKKVFSDVFSLEHKKVSVVKQNECSEKLMFK